MNSFIERFTTAAFAFLNLSATGKSSAESQNLAVAMVTNATLPSQTNKAVMDALVNYAKDRKKTGCSTIAP